MPGDKYLYNETGTHAEKAAIQTSAGAADAGKIIAANSSGVLDTTLMPPGVQVESTSAPAFENLVAGDFVNFFSDSGTLKVRKADASGGVAKQADGFVIAAVTAPAAATVYYGNRNTFRSGMTPGAIQFLSATPGLTTGTSPSTTNHITQKLGKALSATEMLVEIQPPIIIG